MSNICNQPYSYYFWYPSAPSSAASGFYSSSTTGITFFKIMSPTLLYFYNCSTFYNFLPLNSRCQPSGEFYINYFQSIIESPNLLNTFYQFYAKSTYTYFNILEVSFVYIFGGGTYFYYAIFLRDFLLEFLDDIFGVGFSY